LIKRASSTAQAIKVIEKSDSRFHVCVMDRGLGDVEGNEFYLMDRYRKKIPFIIITGRIDTEKGFECSEHGGKKIFIKGEIDFLKNLLPTINEFALKSIVCPGCHESPSPFLSRCYDTLVEKRPLSVKELARYLHMSDRTLRNGCKKYSKIDPKYSICFFNLYSKVFECIEKVGCKGPEIDLEKCNSKIFGDQDYVKSHIRFFKYFLRKRALFDNLLRDPL
jgi:response regulator RpfG family c-di-GMP phosphodiesterase